MRNLYAERLATLVEGAMQYLGGLPEISSVRAGLYTIGYLRNGMTSQQAEKLAVAQGVEVLAVDRCTLKRPDPNALLLGFADSTNLRYGKHSFDSQRHWANQTWSGEPSSLKQCQIPEYQIERPFAFRSA
jgi:DNA-binding transcriptional MocR family regulator